MLRWSTERLDPEPAHPREPSGAFFEAQVLLKAARTGPILAEHEARMVLRAYGIHGPAEAFVHEADEAVRAARVIGYPVVLKAAVPGLAHKTEAGVVAVGIASDEELRAGIAAMVETCRAQDLNLVGVVVQNMARPISELLVGARVDPEFGPIVVVGAGGILVELYRDVSVRPAPVSMALAREMIRETRIGRTLTGWRGRPPADIDAAARVVVRVAELAWEFRAEIEEVEINPLGVLPVGQGALALDCLIVAAMERDVSRAR